jgi:hypothetical protein
VWKSNSIIDEIDRLLGHDCGFTDEELDFIPATMLRAGINYDMLRVCMSIRDGHLTIGEALADESDAAA